ncbi:MAG: hypothetical protein IPP44_15525 [Ideonella sp.]|nr:hypothetical protein [Ideonella sp.]
MPTVSSQQAVARAKQEIQQLYSDDQLRNLALEELELADEGGQKAWAVTLGFQRSRQVSVATGGGAMNNIFARPNDLVEHRVYKTIYIDAETGEFMKMDMRLVQ